MAVVDIAIPCYRYGRFLRQCVESVLAQSMNDVRILIIDDASDDSSGDVARELAASDPRIEASIHETNRGHIATFNEGVAWARAPYFISLSADDYLAPGALERAAGIMAERPEVVLTFGACATAFAGSPDPALSDEKKDAMWDVRPGLSLIRAHCERIRNLVPTPAAIIRTETQKRVGGYLPSLPHTSDLEMWLRLSAHGHVAETPRTQAVYRLHGRNMSAGYYRNVLSDYVQRAAAFDAFFDNHGWRVEGAPALRALARRRLAAAAFWTGVAQWCRGNRKTGANVFAYGLQLNPAMRFAPPLAQLARLERVDLRLKSILADMTSRGPGSPSDALR